MTKLLMESFHTNDLGPIHNRCNISHVFTTWIVKGTDGLSYIATLGGGSLRPSFKAHIGEAPVENLKDYYKQPDATTPYEDATAHHRNLYAYATCVQNEWHRFVGDDFHNRILSVQTATDDDQQALRSLGALIVKMGITINRIAIHEHETQVIPEAGPVHASGMDYLYFMSKPRDDLRYPEERYIRNNRGREPYVYTCLRFASYFFEHLESAVGAPMTHNPRLHADADVDDRLYRLGRKRRHE